MSKLYIKDPNEIIDPSVDWSAKLDLTGSPDDAISSAVWTASTSGASPDSDDLQITGDVIVGPYTNAFISGGEDGQGYWVKILMTAVSGAVFEEYIFVLVNAQEPTAVAAGMTVEDGSIIADANSFVSRDFAAGYHSARDHTDWFELTGQQMDAYLIKAADYMFQQWTDRWKGYRVDVDQTMDWPRAYVQTEDFQEYESGPYSTIFPFNNLAYMIPTTVIPKEVKDCQCYLARELLNGDLNPVLTSGGSVKRVEAGSAAVEFFQGGVAAGGGTKVFPAAEQLVQKLLKPIEHRLHRG